MIIKITHIILTVASLGFFLFSLGSPVFFFQSAKPIKGLHVLGWGWWGFITGNPGWIANWLYGVSITFSLLGNKNVALALSVLAILFALDGFRVTQWYFNEGSGTPVIGLGIGFYYWLTAMCLLPFSVLFSRTIIE
ncbi:MAG: hypothetical protein KBF99_02585 [Leptospiraceae bacterium]|nr:hypothetical protein [Leptospiraceae bacterium]MBK9498944.1 hypothetical protein [Leptospiraceae bacterium]MBL0263850.1 hypothetical protein [Leptospiraceae bacterium]MBP9162034.1 hypothetical protein [Leptospiraceae bacterium]